MEKLAIFGGNPVRTTPLSYGKQYIDREDIAAVTEALISPELTCGPRIAELERKLFIRRYFHLESLEDLGRRFGLSAGQVKSKLHQTRQKLRAELEREGVAV